jgi:YesN/AraC family two-component response regulator
MKTSIKQIANKNSIEIFKVGNLTHKFPMHIHRKICIGKIDSGSMILFMDNQEIKLYKDDFYFIPVNKPHSCYVEDNGQVSYTVLCVDKIQILINAANDKIFKNIVQNENLERLIDFAVKKNTGGITYNNCIISNTINYIETYYMNPMPILSLSKVLKINKYHLLHIFKKEIGLSLHQYILQTRIKKAKERAMDQSDSLDLGLSCGFYDQSHFIRCFKKHVGVTPKLFIASLMTN